VRAARGHQPGRQYDDRGGSRHVLSPRADFGVSLLEVDIHLFSEPFFVSVSGSYGRSLPLKVSPVWGFRGPLRRAESPNGDTRRSHLMVIGK
jgi:hypothetical protein